MEVDWCKNFKDSILIKTKSFTVDIRIPSLISVVTGDSSTGKTLMLNLLKDLQNAGSYKVVESNIELDDIIICTDQNDISYLLMHKDELVGKTIFIDRYDMYYSEDLTKFIKKSPNRFILMSHTRVRLDKFPVYSLITLKYSDNTKTFSTEPLFYQLKPSVQV